ncbi:uncharacterized protein METZ01_LOCUS91645 [marine metagenome]|uniref:Uncharacterized protein n=1 Tax=marine metagenome TaxID=408172 RepID=A0A381VFJ3_9ZZZZ
MPGKCMSSGLSLIIINCIDGSSQHIKDFYLNVPALWEVVPDCCNRIEWIGIIIEDSKLVRKNIHIQIRNAFA